LNSPSKWLIAAVAILSLATAAFLLYDPTPEIAPSRPTVLGDRAAPPDRGAASEAERCAACHAEIVAQYRNNGMSHTWRSAATLPADIKPANSSTESIHDQQTGYRYTIDIQGDSLSQVESVAAERTLASPHNLKRSATYLIGSGKHAIAMATGENGYLFQMPAAWFAKDQRWRLSPGYELQNHRFDRAVSPGCVSCHLGDASRHVNPTDNQYQLPLADGISCSRCHGPTDAHVAYWSENDGDNAGKHASADLIHPNRLPPDQANDLCFQCHLQGDVTIYAENKTASSFQPGDRLRDHRFDFLLQTADSEQLGVASHGARMLQSKCYLESDQSLTCIHCHDGHHAASQTSVATYEAACITCHQPANCSRPAPRGADRCIGCHMPERTAQEGVHLVLTDHAIVRFAPQNTAPPKTLADRNLDEATLASPWPGDDPPPAVLGAAYVHLHQTLGPHRPSIDRALALLASAGENPAIDLGYWQAAAWLAADQPKKAIPLLLSQLANDRTDQRSRFLLALSYEAAGDVDQAGNVYQRIMREAPTWREPYARLAQLYMQAQQPQAAAEVLQSQLDLRPDSNAYSQLGLALAMQGAEQSDVLSAFDKAMALDPQSSLIFQRRAAAYLLYDDAAKAQADFRAAVELSPDNEQAKQALQNLEEM